MHVKFETQTRNVNKLRQAAPFAPRGPAAANVDNGAPAIQEQGIAGGAGIPAGDAAADVAQQDDLNAPPRPNARLSDKPKTLHDLWQEYQHGIGGNIAARLFRSRERGRCKTNSRRNLVWKVVKDMILAGLDADVACERIYQAYGQNKSVSYIINRMYNDKRAAGGKNAPGESWKHPNLRVGV